MRLVGFWIVEAGNELGDLFYPVLWRAPAVRARCALVLDFKPFSQRCSISSTIVLGKQTQKGYSTTVEL